MSAKIMMFTHKETIIFSHVSVHWDGTLVEAQASTIRPRYIPVVQRVGSHDAGNASTSHDQGTSLLLNCRFEWHGACCVNGCPVRLTQTLFSGWIFSSAFSLSLSHPPSLPLSFSLSFKQQELAFINQVESACISVNISLAVA